MTEQLNSKIAMGFVRKIEALQAQIDEVYAAARGYPGTNNDSLIMEIVQSRRSARESQDQAGALLGSLDYNDEGERVSEHAPEVEPASMQAAWPVISERLKAQFAAKPVAGLKRILQQIEIIDRLHAMTVEKGLPVLSLAEFEKEIGRVQ